MNGSATDRKELKTFGITLFFGLATLGGLLLWRKGEIGLFFWAMALAFFLVGLTRPELLASTRRGWMRISTGIGFVMTHFILTILYYGVFTPVGLIMRWTGRDPLQLNIPKGADSYWVRKPPVEFSRERYEKMF